MSLGWNSLGRSRFRPISSSIVASLVRHTDDHLLRTARARVTFSRFQDVCRFGGPDEGLGVLVVSVDVFSDGDDQLFEVLEDAGPNAVLGDVAEEAFDHVES